MIMKTAYNFSRIGKMLYLENLSVSQHGKGIGIVKPNTSRIITHANLHNLHRHTNS